MLEISTSEHPRLETCTCCCTKFIIGKNDIKESYIEIHRTKNGSKSIIHDKTKFTYFRCPICNTENKISLDDNTQLNILLSGRYSEVVDIVKHAGNKVLVDIGR